MRNIILNEGYKNSKFFFEKGLRDKIYINGKSYIDLSHCMGSLILGHNNPFYKKILEKYLKKDISIFAHPNIHALNFSKTIKKVFPNFSKIIFCNSGTEAVFKSLRISRALNKKKYIASTVGSWHGSVDQLLFYPDNKFKTKPLSDGLKNLDKENLIIIPYGDIDLSKKILNKKKNNINCLIIEPIQASLPSKSSKKYLKFLENYCKKNKIILIFDEIITGMRSYKNSVQNNYKIRPDITTIGKIFGGGMPIGIIGLNNKIKNKIESQNKNIFFGGTFSGNSLSTFIGNETVKYLMKKKKLLTELNKKSKYFQETLNEFIVKNNLDLKIYRYASILRIVYTKNKIQNRFQRDFFENKNSLKIKSFRKYLFTKKIHYPTNGIIFFSASSSYSNIRYVIKCIKGGFKKIF